MTTEDGVKAFVRAASRSAGSCVSSPVEESQGCPVSDQISSEGCSRSAPPLVDHAARINMPVVENATSRSQSSQLDTSRQKSSIPIAAGELPKHQENGTDVWMYPSEQQFYNAMTRKGWAPTEKDMGKVVAIHNTVNERAWQHILAWEAMHACECKTPKLKCFQGKPNEFSPKARLLNFLGFKLPFDRHDWVVDRCGKEVRYIIDFYSGKPVPGVPASMHLDVRPALDSAEAAWDRLKMQFDWVLSGRWRQE